MNLHLAVENKVRASTIVADPVQTYFVTMGQSVSHAILNLATHRCHFCRKRVVPANSFYEDYTSSINSILSLSVHSSLRSALFVSELSSILAARVRLRTLAIYKNPSGFLALSNYSLSHFSFCTFLLFFLPPPLLEYTSPQVFLLHLYSWSPLTNDTKHSFDLMNPATSSGRPCALKPYRAFFSNSGVAAQLQN